MPLQYKLEDYYKPESMKQAVELLSKFGKTAKVIAGGTDILPKRQQGVKFDTITHLIDVSNLELNYIKKSKDNICIGAATNINCLATALVFHPNSYHALVEAAEAHSTNTIRNQATIGGNLCNASPCADLALPLLTLSASVVVTGTKGNYTMPLDTFFTGPNCTALLPGEILKEIIIPDYRETVGCSFIKLKHHQTAVDMAVVNVATQLWFDDNRCQRAMIALGAVGPTSFLAKEAADILLGQALNKNLIEKAAKLAADSSAPISDNRATAAYRKEMVAVLVKNSLKKSWKRSGI